LVKRSMFWSKILEMISGKNAHFLQHSSITWL
jgi:hypothetical protein